LIVLDVVSHRELFARLRSIFRKIPFAWWLYGQYWRIRRWMESRRQYPESVKLANLGVYSAPSLASPVSQLCTAEQMLSLDYERWCDAMHSPARFSRKQWEFVFILQALEKSGMLAKGKRGLGFGCGREPLAGLFALRGCQVLATDLDPAAAHDQGWVATMQHAASHEALYECASEFLSREDFDARVTFQNADMNCIPVEFDEQFDFVWSACAFEHLGSLRHGMEFVKNSLRCLKPGGVAIHTTEFNLSSDDQTFESPGCSLFRARDIKQLLAEINEQGYEAAPLNLNSGKLAVDRHIDLPPYGFSPHIKLMLEGYVVTSIGLIIRKPAGNK